MRKNPFNKPLRLKATCRSGLRAESATERISHGPLPVFFPRRSSRSRLLLRDVPEAVVVLIGDGRVEAETHFDHVADHGEEGATEGEMVQDGGEDVLAAPFSVHPAEDEDEPSHGHLRNTTSTA